MDTKYKLKAENTVYWVLGCLVLALVAKEAYVIPLTHDELSTLDISKKSIFNIISYADPIPNNHILNTLLIKLNTAIFGEHLFTSRLHNVLSFIPFYLFTVLSAKLLFKDNWLRMAMIGLICLQPFLLDFYAVTRGYGLSVAFQMISLYYFFMRLKRHEERYLIYSILLAAIAVYANFTLLNYYLPLCFLLGVHTVLTYKNERRIKIYKSIGILASVSFALGFLCYLPFYKMITTNQFVYWGTSNFITDTVKPLIISLRSGVEYFNCSNEVVYKVVLVFISLVVFLGMIFYKRLQNLTSFMYALGLLLLVLLYNNLQFYLVGVPFLNARTALFFIPIVAICVCLGLDAVIQKNKFIGLLMTICTISLSAQHFVRGYNVKVNYEWYFDQNTYNVLDELNNQISANNLQKPVMLDCHWLYHPSLTYHINEKYRGIIELRPYHKETDSLSQALFYYSESNESEVLSKYFDKVRDFSGGNSILWKHK